MNLPALQPGDILLYEPDGFFGRLIAVKTWSKFSHVEVYDGGFYSVASRDGIGVGRYGVRMAGLACVLRPVHAVDMESARDWFRLVRRQGYDWIGLLSFICAKWQGRENKKQFCSEFATRFLRAGGVDPFNGYDADGIAPGEFVKSPAFTILWEGTV